MNGDLKTGQIWTNSNNKRKENKMKHYYAGWNAYGINTVNCWRIVVFDTRAERDEYVVKNDDAESLTASEARRRLNGGNASASDTVMFLLGYNPDLYGPGFVAGDVD